MGSGKKRGGKIDVSEIREAIVAPGSLKGEGRGEMLESFRSIRKKIAEDYTIEDEQIARFLQLKFLIEDYLSSELFTNHYFFGYFLKEYISRQDKRSKDFAWEIDVDPAELSLIINRHRKPTEKLIFRLDIHSNRNFPAQLWFKVLEKDREIELLRNTQLIEREKKHVKRKLSFSF